LRQGFGKPGNPPREIRIEVNAVRFVDEKGKECDPFNVPDDFWPISIAVHLGPRYDCNGKYLRFTRWDSPDDCKPLFGCIGSLGTLRKLYFMGDTTDWWKRFSLHTDDGVYNLSSHSCAPGFMDLRFMSVWREDVAGGGLRGVMFFNAQIVASLEKAGLSFGNNSRAREYKKGDEIELLDEYAAISYLQESNEFRVDTWWFGYLPQVLWCDRNFRPLCESREDFVQAAKLDHGLWSVLSASKPDNSNFLHEEFLRLRYDVYASVRNGVTPKWDSCFG
jgi:hypothetical protein